MKFSSQIFLLGLMLLGSVSLTACSSSQVGKDDTPVDSVDELADESIPSESPTDAIPAEPTEESTAVADVPASEIPAAEEPVVEQPMQETSVAEAPISDTPVSETPVAETPVAEPVLDDQVAAEPEVQFAAEPTTDSSNASAYQVKKGDTLMKIAFEQYGDLYRWKEIYNSNREKIKDPSQLPPGIQLSLNGTGMVTIERNGESYLIKKGDTLGLISNDVYGTSRKWKKLWENNRQLIKDPNRIYAGFYLYYVPERKLTHDEVAPGLKGDDSAMTAPQVSTAPREPASTEAVDTNAVQAAPGNRN